MRNLVRSLAFFCSLIFTIMNISALTAPQRYNLQKTSPALLAASNKGIEALLPKEDIRTFRLLNRLPKEIKSGELFKRHFTTQELLRLYDDLSAIKQNLDETTGSNIYDVSDLLDDQGNFKGNNILAAIQDFAARKLAKKINCTVDSMQDGSCQPLITSTDPEIPENQKQRKPFEEITQPWTKNWIQLLSNYEQYENTLPSDKRILLPVTFLKRIFNTPINQKLPNAFIQAVTETARQEGFEISQPTIRNNDEEIRISYSDPITGQISSLITLTTAISNNNLTGLITMSKNYSLGYLLHLKDFPQKIRIFGPHIEQYQEDEKIIFTIIKALAKAMGVLSLEILYSYTLSNEERTFYEQLGFRENEHGQLVLNLQPEINT